MRTQLFTLAVLLCAAPVWAQTQTTPPTTPPPKPAPVQKPPKEEVYVRRFSAGATLSIMALPTVKDVTTSNVTTSPPVDAVYTTTGPNNSALRIGYGVTMQVALTGRFALNVSLLRRRVSYKMKSDAFTGTDNPLTNTDERTHTVQNEDTRARLYDFSGVLRYYAKHRLDPGPRFFAEFGGAIRRVSNIRTAIDTTVNDGTLTCCDTTPAASRHNVHGLVGGIGVQLIDPVGIRVVPEVRYTRWMGETFHNLSTATQRNQIEAMISLTF